MLSHLFVYSFLLVRLSSGVYPLFSQPCSRGQAARLQTESSCGVFGESSRLSTFRSPQCEGCEWGWISEALREDPSVFRRIDQMFLEVHFATTLRFDDTALSLAPTLRSAIVQHFVVGWSDYNLGMRVDRHRLPAALVTAGANKKACCREFFLINKRHVSSGLA